MGFRKYLSNYKGEAIFTFSNIITSIVSLVSGLIAAAFVAPEDLGIIQAILLVNTYASFLHLGVFNGLNRNIAFYKAKGDTETVQREVDTSHTVSVAVALAGGVIGGAVLVSNAVRGRAGAYLWGSILLLFTMVLTPLTNHIECTFRSGQEFRRLGKIKNWQAAVYLLASFLPVALNYIGRVLAQIINLSFGYILRLHKPPYRHRGHGDYNSFKDLVATGAPLLIGGYIWSVFAVADKTYIASALSPRDMGLYTVSGYCITLMMMIPNALNTLLYPKAASNYGRTGDKSSLLGFWKKSLVLFAIVLFPMCVASYFALPYVVEIFMPKYMDGVQAARVSLLTCMTFVYMGPSVVFGTLKKNVGYILAISFCLLFFWGTVSVFKAYFCTIERVALLKFAISFILMLFVIVYSYKLIRK